MFDFTPGVFGLLGKQFGIGPLNTDRRHVVNILASYVFDRTRFNGLTLGVGFRLQSGLPLTTLIAQQPYNNTGEVPVNGRGDLGRAPVNGTLDIHTDYPWHLGEHMRLRFGMDLFNIGDSTRTNLINQNPDLSFGVTNQDYKKPTKFQRPFYARAMVRFEF